jgi:LacI family repressor for deo operon, udp, cdd, tsx, nupC, and nupG
MRASIRDVAKRAGVSAMTVSNVLRRRVGSVSEETRLRVLEALQELDYIPVRSAAQNRHIETNALGVIFLQDMQGFVGERTFWGMSERAKEQDHDLLIVLRSKPEWMRRDVAAQLLDRRCDGYIIIGSYQPALSAMLVAHRVPVVECYSVNPPPGVARVAGDDRGAVRQAVELLWGLGHRRIAHLGGPMGDGEADLRADTFGAVVREKGNAENAVHLTRDQGWGNADPQARPSPEIRCFLDKVLAAGMTAIVCASDALALELWQAAAEKGLHVPQDLSITGIDNIQQGRIKGLTSVDTAFEQVGRAAVTALISLVKGMVPEKAGAVAPARLIQRHSAAPVRLSR